MAQAIVAPAEMFDKAVMAGSLEQGLARAQRGLA
jgi:hypothetical protein